MRKILNVVITGMMFFLSIHLYAQCPMDNDFIEVTVRGGATIYGSTVIKLTHEGLIFSWVDENWKNNSYFICLDSLNYKQYREIEYYIWKKLINLKNKNLVQPDDSYIFFGFNTYIEFLNIRETKYTVLKYIIFDKRIDKLIMMLIGLIPEKYQQHFSALRMCDK